MISERPSITCIVFSYNHGAYIVKCLESIISQVGNFELRIVVHDDHSDDDTVTLASSFFEAKGIHAEVITNRENLHSQGLDFFWDIIRATDSKYVRFISADDYFTQSDVFERQIAILENHKEVALCHANYVTSISSEIHGPQRFMQGRIYSGVLLGLGNQIGALTAVFRRSMFPAQNSVLLREGSLEDYPLWLELSKKGKIAHLKLTSGVLRIHESNLWSAQSAYTRAQLVEDYEELLSTKSGLPGGALRRLTLACPRKLRPIVRLLLAGLIAPFCSERGNYA